MEARLPISQAADGKHRVIDGQSAAAEHILVVLVVVIVIVGEAPCPRIDQDLAGLPVLRAQGLEKVPLADDLDVRVAVRLQLLPDLGFGQQAGHPQ